MKGFWSLTLYNSVHMFHPNALGRYSLGTKNKTLKYNSDGSLTLYASANSPGKDRESNWLPAPEGTFSLYFPIAARRAAQPEKAGFLMGFLTGHEVVRLPDLAEIISVVSGRLWSNFIHERIFQPLGMNDTLLTSSTVRNQERADPRPDLVSVPSRSGTGRVAAVS